MKKKFLFPVLIIIAVFAVGIAAGVFILSYSGVGISTGVCLVTDNGSVFLVSENSPVRLSDYSENTDRLSDIKTGDKIIAVHDGVAESYPASTGLLFYVKLAEGKDEEIPRQVILSLKELGWISEADTAVSAENIGFNAKYLKTALPQAEHNYPLVTVICDSEEMKAYLENKEDLGLTEELINQTEKYDDGFFAEKTLILCLLEEGSGSISHNVEKVLKTEGKYADVYINKQTPEVGTCDMAYHHIFVEIDKNDFENTDVRLFIDGLDSSKKYTTVREGREFASISLRLPEGWEYETDMRTDSPDFSITVYHGDCPEENISIEFLDGFGVCGTGLRTEETEINGYKAHKGIYDGNPTFDYICFEDTPGNYVIFNNADGDWWSKYGDTAEEILSTLEIAEGILFRPQALDIAGKTADGENKRQYSEFDCEKGIWSFVFEKDDTSQTVQVSASGKII